MQRATVEERLADPQGAIKAQCFVWRCRENEFSHDRHHFLYECNQSLPRNPYSTGETENLANTDLFARIRLGIGTSRRDNSHGQIFVDVESLKIEAGMSAPERSPKNGGDTVGE